MNRTTWIAAPLVFASGLCALIYQVVWTRELRFVFGASTAASSAVVAIFIAGLGFGGLWFGSRAERTDKPLALYARLEIGIAVLSALTPWLLDLVRALYEWSGGSLRLGIAGSTFVRLLLSVLVLGPATWLMGGTLPAMARTVETDADTARKGVAVIYGVNTLGAVAGAALSTFVLLEQFGSRNSLYLAALLNVLVAVVAWFVARSSAPGLQPVAASSSGEPSAPVAPPVLVFASAAVVGFAFFLMELVWYRMLGPLLGGTIFTFGLILAVALAGIGVGSALYAALLSGRRKLLIGFAFTCALEALFIAIPYALGDRIAMWALMVRPLGSLGFHGFVFGWTLITAIVVFPAALIAGIQFPMLISLLGGGRENVGRDVGRAYAANTLGAISGALAGGFGLMPAIGALGGWRLVCALLAGWGALMAVVAIKRQAARISPVWVFAISGITIAAIAVPIGPTAAWRHSPIGAGRMRAQQIDGPNTMIGFVNSQRRGVDWQVDGIESTIGIDHYDAVGFIVNGKSDGNARADAPTQVMGGLVGAALVPQVKRAMVIGLGTGSTAGWLGKVPEIERVDVAEIEPAIMNVAARCELVNEFVLQNPKVRIHRGDARELLSVSRENYDVIFSEPSNPYRAGVASLYTREFYEQARERLAKGGVFVQWLQAYDVDSDTLRSVYATMAEVFPHVETWDGMKHDLLLVASMHEPVHDLTALRKRVEAEPFVRAMRIAWNTDTLEGFLGHYLANVHFSKEQAKSGAPINTDDKSPVEFGFARNLRGTGYTAAAMYAKAIEAKQNRPKFTGPVPDWDRVDYEREAFTFVSAGIRPSGALTPLYRSRFEMLSLWSTGNFQGALGVWNRVGSENKDMNLILIERHVIAELFAYYGVDETESWVQSLTPEQPTLSLMLRAVWLQRHGKKKEAIDVLVQALHQYRIDPWPMPSQMARAFNLMTITSDEDKAFAPLWVEALSVPFAVYVNETARERTMVKIAGQLGTKDPTCLRALAPFEQHPDWTESMLDFRVKCYKDQKSPLLARAQADLKQYFAAAPVPYEKVLSKK